MFCPQNFILVMELSANIILNVSQVSNYGSIPAGLIWTYDHFEMKTLYASKTETFEHMKNHFEFENCDENFNGVPQVYSCY